MDDVNALACVGTVMTEPAPIVLRVMSMVDPAFGPDRMWTLYPRKSRASVIDVMIVVTLPPVAVIEVAAAVAPALQPVAHTAVPAPKVPARAGEGSCDQPSESGWYR